MAAHAAELFMTATLPLDPVDGVTQSPQDYVEQLSSTTGLPHVLVRRNMRKIHGVLSQMGDVIAGLTRGLDISVLDTGVGESDGHLFSFYPARRTRWASCCRTTRRASTRSGRRPSA